jgi:menaquinol-cytochrome c reductase iron-sulfur subunit
MYTTVCSTVSNSRLSPKDLPGTLEGETVSRRRFMNRTVHVAGAVTAAAMALPALGFAVGPVFGQAKDTWQDIGPLERFDNTTYVPVAITIEPGIGEVGRSTAFVRRHSDAIDGPPKDRYDHVVAISSRCVHIGCPVRFVAAAGSFVCPCHGGVYDFRGIRVGGPPPRPLDRFYTMVTGRRVFVGRATA